MERYIHLSIYIIAIVISFMTLWFVDFNKFIRVDKKMYAILVYVLVSFAIGFAIGKLLIEIGNIFLKFAH